MTTQSQQNDPNSVSILESHLDEFLRKREPPKTFCPSEVARALSPQDLTALGYTGWRDAMPDIRHLAWSRSDCEIVQKGETLHCRLDEITGAIRLRRVGLLANSA